MSISILSLSRLNMFTTLPEILFYAVVPGAPDRSTFVIRGPVP
nr:hypothetical protein [uncultured Desulfobacter sp.]